MAQEALKTMTVATFEGVVEQGKISLPATIRLPDKLKVYVVVPDFQVEQVGRILRPRLVHPEQAVDFRMDVREDEQNAGV